MHKFPLGHFYSSVPSDQDVARAIARRTTALALSPQLELTGVDVREKHQLALMQHLAPYYKEIDFPRTRMPSHYYYYANQSFSFSDAIVYACMIRHLRPKRIVEIGAGFSTAAAVDTIRRLDYDCNITALDPYPRPMVQQLAHDNQIELINQAVQDVPNSLFHVLQPNDILFVDSTHVMKAGSDVHHIFFEVLPLLSVGVYIHFHDMFWPWEYPVAWLQARNNWNELYVMKTFLQYNQCFDIELFLHFLWRRHPSAMKCWMPAGAENHGGGLWLKRVR